jgi:hypothetical protein
MPFKFKFKLVWRQKTRSMMMNPSRIDSRICMPGSVCVCVCVKFKNPTIIDARQQSGSNRCWPIIACTVCRFQQAAHVCIRHHGALHIQQASLSRVVLVTP